MSLSQSLELNVNGTKVVRKTVTSTSEAKLSQSYTVDDGQTDEQHAIDMDISEVKSLYVNSTQDITLEWNNGAGAEGSIAMLSDEPVLWWSTQKTKAGVTINPLGTDNLTDFFWTNASGGDAVINIEIVYDASP